MDKIALRRNVIGVVSVGLSWALGLALYKAFSIADFKDLEKENLSIDRGEPKTVKKTPPPVAPKPSVGAKMKEFSGHGKAVSDNVPESKKVAQNKQLIAEAKDSQMLA